MPERAEAWANLAHVRLRRAEADLAREAYLKGWELRPALRALATKAIEALDEADQLADYGARVKQDAETLTEPLAKAGRLCQLALLAEPAGDTAEMLARIHEAIRLDDSDEERRRLFIDLLLAEERYYILGLRLKDWIERFDVVYEHLALAQCRIEAGFIEIAKEGLQAIKERTFGDPEWDSLWARALAEEGDYAGARATLETVLERHPEHVPTINQLSDVLASLGEIERAIELTEQVAEHAPAALLRLVEHKKTPTAEDAERLEALLERFEDQQPQTNVRFTLAHVLDRLGEYARAGEVIQAANAALWSKLDYNAADFTKQVDELISGFDRRWVEGHRVETTFPVRPIFIIGMPRSGTTLLEQIFAAHPSCYGGGELPFMPRIRRLSERITKKDYPASLLTANRDLLKDAAAYYLELARRALAFDESVLVDKLPHNFLDAALICTLFPEGRVIALRRDYRAIALSNYFQNFAARRGALGYAFDLTAMGHQLRDFHRLMDHWRRELPAEQYREFHYEELVQQPDTAIPEVLAFCGLEFTPEVLEFYRNKTAVRTASVRQVRNPLYTGSVEKWRHYETMLQPVIDVVTGGEASR